MKKFTATRTVAAAARWRSSMTTVRGPERADYPLESASNLSISNDEGLASVVEIVSLGGWFQRHPARLLADRPGKCRTDIDQIPDGADAAQRPGDMAVRPLFRPLGVRVHRDLV